MSDGVLHRLEYRLSYGDCDPAGIVYYAAYYPWMERVYNEWCYLQGIGSDRMADLWGCYTNSRASGCEYRKPGQLFDLLGCEMHLDRIGTTSYTVGFDQIRQADGVVIAAGFMTLVFMNEQRRPVPVPEQMRDKLLQAGPARAERTPAR